MPRPPGGLSFAVPVARLVAAALATASLFCPLSAHSSESQAKVVELAVALVEDPEFPLLDEAMIRGAFDHAGRAVRDRLEFDGLRFEIKTRISAQ